MKETNKLYYIRDTRNGLFLKYYSQRLSKNRVWVEIGKASHWKTKDKAIETIRTAKASLFCEVYIIDLCKAPYETESVFDNMTQGHKNQIIKQYSPIEIAQARMNHAE